MLGPVGDEAINRIVNGVPNAEENPNDGGIPRIESEIINEEIIDDGAFGEAAHQ